MELTDEQLVERFAPYHVDRDNREYYRGWLDHELRLNRCRDCGRWHNPPRPMCPDCWSWNVEPTPVSGRGTVHLMMWLRQGPSAPGVDYAKGPHPVVTVELDEQESLRVTATIADAGDTEVTIGTPVELVWIDREGMPVPAFRPRAGEVPA